MLRSPRFRLRSYIFSLIALVVLALPPTGKADADTVPDQARWKNGELLAPLPSDPAARAAAIDRAVALGAARVQPLSAKSATFPSSAVRPQVGYPVRGGVPPRRRGAPAPDPAKVAWLDALQSRLRQSEQAAATGVTQAPAVASGSVAPAVELTPASPALPPTTTFDGIDDTGFDPGSPDIAVGPDHILLATTDRYAIMDKCGNILVEDLFRNLFGQPVSRSYYTPKVVYDPWFPHYVMIYIGTETNYSNSVLYIAFSLTADPLGSWSTYMLDTSVAFPGLKDAPSIAVTPGQIYITYNQFNLSTFAYEQVVMLELVKTDVYGNAPLSYFSHQGMTNPNDASPAVSIQPAQMRTYGGAMYFVNSSPFGSSFMTLWRLTGSPGASVLTAFDVSVPAYTAPPDMAQPDLSLVEAGDCRIRDAVYASGNIYAAYTRNNAGSPTVETRRIDVETLVGNGIFLGGGDDIAYPAIDIDENDQITMAYCITGPARLLGVGYNILAFPSTGITSGPLVVGLANFSSGGSPARWGHYIGADLDPTDGRTVWIQGCYASNDPLNSWTTRVGAVTAFPPSIFVANTMSTTSVAGFEGGPFAPEQIDFKLDNAGGTTMRWSASGVPSWLTPEALSGSLDAGASEIVSFFVDADANALPGGSYGGTIRFTNCMGGAFYDFPVLLSVGIDGSCPGARVTLAPPFAPTGSLYTVGAEAGTFVTSIEDVAVCAIGVQAALDTPQIITVAVYAADGITRLAPIATNFALAVTAGTTAMHYVPLEVYLDACQEYDIAVSFDAGATWVYWDDTQPGLLPGDVGGLMRLRDAEAAGNAASTFMPQIVLITEGEACTNSTSLDAGAGEGFEVTASTAQGLFVQPERTLRLCSLALQADLTPGAALTARVYSVFGSTRTALLAEGTTIVTSPLFTFHDVPISQVLLAGSQYDLEVEFEGTGGWWSYSTPPAIIPYSVDNTMQVYGGEAAGVVTSLLPRLRLAWTDLSAGTPFDLAKPGGGVPLTSGGALTHGAYITALADQEVYGLGVMADVPKGEYVLAFLYEATGTTRGPFVTSGIVTSDGAGMQWHDIPISASLTAGQYDIMFSAPSATSWPYWNDSPGLPYDAYGWIRVRDAEAGGVVGTSFLAHMRVHACNPVLTAVGDRPQRAPMLLDPPAPNPATGVVRFGYSIDEAGELEIAVYDARGARVADVARVPHAGVGRSAVDFDARKLPSGVYFVKLTTPTKSTSRKFVVMH